MLSVDIEKNLDGFQLNTSFAVNDGILAILGRSGSGKTMTLRCIAGLVKPDQGSIVLDDQILYDSSRGINLKPQDRRVGFVFQNYALFPHMSCYDNIAFGVGSRSKQDTRQKVADIMERLKISSLAGRRPGQISGGQQQRVALARALATSPDILLLDEPFSALDTITRESMQRVLLEVEQFYTGQVILVTHNLAEAYRLSSNIAIYDRGELLQMGPKQEVLDNPASLSAAALTGVRNLWPGSIAEIQGDQVLVELADAQTRFWVNSRRERLKTGQKVIMGFRTEESTLVQQTADNSIPGRIVKIIEEISSHAIFIEPLTKGLDIHIETVIAKNQPSWQVGQTCWLQIPSEKIFIIPR